MPTGLSPRAALPADLPALVRLINRAYGVEAFCLKGDRTDEAELRSRLEAGCFLVLPAERDPSLLRGCVFLSMAGGRGYLGLLAVDPACQGRGLAAALVNAVEEQCRAAGCAFLDLSVVNLRKELFPLYARLGFTPSAVLPFPEPEKMLRPLHLVQMTKALRAAEDL